MTCSGLPTWILWTCFNNGALYEPQNLRKNSTHYLVVGRGGLRLCSGASTDHAAQTREERRQVCFGGPVGEKDEPRHQRRKAAARHAIESSLGGVRREPGERSLWTDRENRR